MGAQGKPEGEMRWALYVIDPRPWSAPLEEVRLKSKKQTGGGDMRPTFWMVLHPAGPGVGAGDRRGQH